MPIFDVLLTRTEQAHVFVEADTRDQALLDADQIVDDTDYVDVDDEHEITGTVDKPTHRYWSGGEEGRWVYP